MAAPRRFNQTGMAFVNTPHFTPGATSKIAKIDYSMVRTRGVNTRATHAIGGHPRGRCDIIGELTLCGIKVTQNGTLLDYKRPGGPSCRACAMVVFTTPQEA